MATPPLARWLYSDAPRHRLSELPNINRRVGINRVRLLKERFRWTVPKFARDIGSVFVNQVLVLASGLISGVLAARLLGPEGKGALVVGTLMAGLTGAVAHLGLPWAVTYRVARIREEPLVVSETLKVCIRILPLNLLLIAAVYSLTFSLGRHTLWRGVDYRVAITSSALSVCTLLLVFLTSLLGGVQNFRARNTVAVISPALLAVAVLYLALARRPVSPLLLLRVNVFCAACGVAAGIVYVVVKYRPSWRVPVRRRWIQEYLGYGLKFHLALVAQGLNYRLDSLIINAFIGNAMLGLYSVAVTVAELLLRIPEAVNFVLYPRLSAAKVTERDRITVVTLGTAMYIVGGGGIVLMATLPWIIPLAYGGAFANAVPAAYWLIPGMLALTVVKIVCHVAAGFGRPVYATYITTIGLVVTIPLDVFLVPRWGIVGAAVASTTAYTASAVAAVLLYGLLERRPGRNVFSRSLSWPFRWVRERHRANVGGA